MKLIDLLSVINDRTVVVVFSERRKSVYDGKNSIDTDLNDHEVNEIKVVKNELWIDLEV